jgi:hypothetical protein
MPDPSSCVSGAGTRRVLQEGERQIFTATLTPPRKTAITRRRTIRPHCDTCKASFDAVLLSFKGAFEQAKSNRCLDCSSVRMAGARTLRQARRYRHIAEALICLASLRRPSSSASVGAPRVLAGLITRYVWFSSRNSVKCTVKAGVLTSELGNRNSPIHLGLSPQ